MSSIKVASRYAKSIIDLAREKDKLDVVYNDILLIRDVIRENRDFLLMLRSPVVFVDKKKKIVDLIFRARIDDLTMTFLNIVIGKKRENVLPDIIREYIRQYQNERNIVPVKITTAIEISDSEMKTISDKVQKEYNFPDIEMETRVNEDLIGGFILEFQNKLYNASVAHKLEELRQSYSKNPYIKQI